MTGGADGGLHITGVTNAGRTQMMNIEALDWDAGLLAFFGVPPACLPPIKPSSGLYGEARAVLAGAPIGGILRNRPMTLP